MKWVHWLQMLVRGMQASCFAFLVVFDDWGMNYSFKLRPLAATTDLVSNDVGIDE